MPLERCSRLRSGGCSVSPREKRERLGFAALTFGSASWTSTNGCYLHLRPHRGEGPRGGPPHARHRARGRRPAASGSAVSFGARKMMTGASVQASRVVQTAAGRKSLVWCVSDPRDASNVSSHSYFNRFELLRAPLGVERPRRAAIAEAAGGFRFARSSLSRVNFGADCHQAAFSSWFFFSH